LSNSQGSKKVRLNEKVNLLKSSLRPDYPKKDIGTLIRYHKTLREGLFSEIVEDVLGERKLLTRLERYGEDSKFW
jgi:hypothetical protein